MDLKQEVAALKAEVEKLKREVRQKAQANPLDQEPRRLIDQTPPPKVKNVQLIPNLNSITITVDPIRVRDLRNYEIQVSESPFMFDPTSYASVEPRFTLEEVTPSNDFYFRVRAINNSGRKGDWTNIYPSAPKLADTIHLELEAATALASLRVQGGGFYLQNIRTDADGINTFSETGEAQLTVLFDEAADIEVATTYTFYLSPYTALDTARTTLRFDGSGQSVSEFRQSASSSFVDETATLQAQIANVPAGGHSVDLLIEVETAGGAPTVLKPKVIETQIYRSKR